MNKHKYSIFGSVLIALFHEVISSLLHSLSFSSLADPASTVQLLRDKSSQFFHLMIKRVLCR
jgi:hypothetical protein